MKIDTLISLDAVVVNTEIKSKKRALEQAAQLLAQQLIIVSNAADNNLIEDKAENFSVSTRVEEKKPATQNAIKTDNATTDNATTDNNTTDKACALSLFQHFSEREKLGSTAIGHGVALPHARTKLTQKPLGAFVKLNTPINFDSPDEEKIDLIFALIVPESFTDEHLQILAALAGIFSNRTFCDNLRTKHEAKDIYQMLITQQVQVD